MPRGGVSKRGANSTQSGRSRRPTNSSVGPVSSLPLGYPNHPMLPFPDKQQTTHTNAAASSSGSQDRPLEINFDIDTLFLQTAISLKNLTFKDHIALAKYRKREDLTEDEKETINRVRTELMNLMNLNRENETAILAGIPDDLKELVSAQFATFDHRISAASGVLRRMYVQNTILKARNRDRDEEIAALKRTVDERDAQIGTQNTALSNLQKRNEHLKNILGMSGFNPSNIEGLDGSSSQDKSHLPPSHTQPDSSLWPDQSDRNHGTMDSNVPLDWWMDPAQRPLFPYLGPESRLLVQEIGNVRMDDHDVTQVGWDPSGSLHPDGSTQVSHSPFQFDIAPPRSQPDSFPPTQSHSTNFNP
ncbi:hypothetical protein L204_105297 [Cryptococcus depauperatus]|nr:hypothetical protein L204_06313 [Cryptococcus depauperatus CBS 7855]